MTRMLLRILKMICCIHFIVDSHDHLYDYFYIVILCVSEAKFTLWPYEGIWELISLFMFLCCYDLPFLVPWKLSLYCLFLFCLGGTYCSWPLLLWNIANQWEKISVWFYQKLMKRFKPDLRPSKLKINILMQGTCKEEAKSDKGGREEA